MKNILRLLLLVGLSASVILSGCSARVYGVPKEEWQRMSPAEQHQARAAYQERMRLYEERRLYEAKQRAHEAELKAQKAREEAPRQTRQQHAQTPAIIHFSLDQGTIYIAGRHHSFRPVSVELRDGESKHLQLVTTDERKSHHVQLVCSYEEGVLKLSNGKSRVHVQKFSYDKQWQHGRHYKNLTLSGGVGLRGGVMRVASGPLPALSPSHSLPNHDRGENPGGGHGIHRSAPNHPGKQPSVSANQRNNGKAQPAPKAESHGNDRAPGSSISAIAKGKEDNGSKEVARNPGQGNRLSQVKGQSQARGQAPDKAQNSNGSKKPNKKKDDAQPEVSQVEESPNEDEQVCGEAKGNKDKRMDCGNKPVVNKFNPKNRPD